MFTYENGTNDKLLDDVNLQLLEALQQDARISYAQLGRRVGLSAPAVQERIRKLEDAGIIKGYRADVDCHKLGRSIIAFTRVANAGQSERHIQKLVRQLPEVLECHHVVGNDCFIIKLGVPDMQHLEHVLYQINQYAQTTTSIVLSTLLERAVVMPLNAPPKPDED